MNLSLFKKFLFVFFATSFSNHLSGFGKILKNEFICKNLISQNRKDKELLFAITTNNLDDVKRFLNLGANINAINDSNNWGDWDGFYSRRMSGGYNAVRLGFPNYDKYSALMLSVNPRIVNYLIKNGADINYEFMACLNREELYIMHEDQTNSLRFYQRTKINVVDIAILNSLSHEVFDHNSLMLKTILLLKAGARPNKLIVDILRKKANENDLVAKEILSFLVAKEILSFLDIQKIRNKNKKRQYTRETLPPNIPSEVINLIGEYITGETSEDEEKRGQE